MRAAVIQSFVNFVFKRISAFEPALMRSSIFPTEVIHPCFDLRLVASNVDIPSV